MLFVISLVWGPLAKASPDAQLPTAPKLLVASAVRTQDVERTAGALQEDAVRSDSDTLQASTRKENVHYPKQMGLVPQRIQQLEGIERGEVIQQRLQQRLRQAEAIQSRLQQRAVARQCNAQEKDVATEHKVLQT
eukprot:gnl/TRDRNA2_/TRDRNA2_176254_c0_seq3.p2 gnl/TRDRNA2_/TRDRNA2_176254_c0~~gnl/TRDRNA2_/TRDRNA2_176254_c0_seq3.p2  ORF type:complete len:135 (-),score=40.50 gnl/TRDRNA2_/TRDRNA2_176254_c0_seq3:53-457(-)